MLLAVLDRKQQREIEIYAGVEPINNEIGVSRPKKDESDDSKTNDIESKIDAVLGQFPVKIQESEKP